MPLTIRGYFLGPKNYAYVDVVPGPDDDCMICFEPYTDEPAIQLLDCGHTIGLHCFRHWIRHQPDKCPYMLHALPCKQGDSSLLGRCCNSKFFASLEDGFFLVIEFYSRGLWRRYDNDLRMALDALHEDRLDRGSTAIILFAYGLAGYAVLLVCDSFVLCFTDAADLLLCGVFSVKWLGVLIHCCGVGILSVFIAILISVLWRSNMQSRKKKQS